eukprot:433425_1
MGLLDKTKSAIVINHIVIWTTCIINLSVLCYHCYHTLFSSIKVRLLQQLSILNILCWCIFNVLNVLIIQNWHNTDCKTILVVTLVFYSTSKLIFYYIFLERLFMVFSDSMYRVSIKWIYFTRCIFILYTTMATTECVLYGNGYYNHYTSSCKSNHPFWINIQGALIDIIISAAISIVFTRKLLMMSLATISFDLEQGNNASSVNKLESASNKHRGIWRTVRKTTLLSLIALITTPASLILISIFGLVGTFTSADSSVNVVCLMLMFAVHKQLFFRICGRCESCLTAGCLSCYSCNLCFPISSNKD